MIFPRCVLEIFCYVYKTNDKETIVPGASYEMGALIILLLLPNSSPVSSPDSVRAKFGDMMAMDATS